MTGVSLTGVSNSEGVRYVGPPPLNIAFIRYPAHVEPDGFTIAFVEGPSWRAVAHWRAGEWKDDKGRPLRPDFAFWTIIDPDFPR